MEFSGGEIDCRSCQVPVCTGEQ
ncbi:unnamed protein product [Linum tenue]|uniref:Uncharacterized protein n=1 Tax=Linum tenue TaxID=586396 RepID=A0AAV0J1M2_9ROSI|nr:unnamed protein product [Linum tenue]